MRGILSVEVVGDDTGQETWTQAIDVVSGGRLTFGDCRAPGHCILDIRVHGAAGHITAHDGYWTVSNDSADVPLHVLNAERPDEYVTLRPRQGGTPMPWDFARIIGTGGHVMTVFGPEVSENESPPSCAGKTAPAWGLDTASLHYRVLLAIIEPLQNGDPSLAPPSANEIATKLGITVRQAYEHTDYLVAKLGIARPSGRNRGEWKRQAIFNYVRTHPAEIPPASGEFVRLGAAPGY